MTTYAPDYDPLHSATYDPSYTANISNRMQVPDSIQLGNQSKSPLHDAPMTGESPRTKMQVPQRIMLAGDDQHIGGREQFRTTPPDLDLANARAPANYVPLSTPPRVLTIDDSFPSIQPSGEEVKEAGQGEPRDATTIHGRHDQSLLNGLLTMDTSYRSMTPPIPLATELMADDSLYVGDDNPSLSRHVARLQRHVINLEEENYLRSRREMILYPTLLLYFLFQIGKWFIGRN